MAPPLESTAHRGQGFNLGLVAILDKPETVKVYAEHPAHQKSVFPCFVAHSEVIDRLTTDEIEYTHSERVFVPIRWRMTWSTSFEHFSHTLSKAEQCSKIVE